MVTEKLPFDRVVLAAEGQRYELSAEAFLELPLHRRIAHILKREVDFFSGRLPVDRRNALQSLRRLNES